MQVMLKNMMLNAEQMKNLMREGASAVKQLPVATTRAGALVFSLIPVLIVYPFLQKYFVKGTMIGSVKG